MKSVNVRLASWSERKACLQKIQVVINTLVGTRTINQAVKPKQNANCAQYPDELMRLYCLPWRF